MSERGKDVIRRLAISVPQLNKEERKYLLGVADGLLMAKSNREVAEEPQKELQEA